MNCFTVKYLHRYARINATKFGGSEDPTTDVLVRAFRARLEPGLVLTTGVRLSFRSNERFLTVVIDAADATDVVEALLRLDWLERSLDIGVMVRVESVDTEELEEDDEGVGEGGRREGVECAGVFTSRSFPACF